MSGAVCLLRVCSGARSRLQLFALSWAIHAGLEVSSFSVWELGAPEALINPLHRSIVPFWGRSMTTPSVTWECLPCPTPTPRLQ